MLTKRIIPCLDVKAGRVVKGVKFLDHRDAGDPVALAAFYDAEGADELVFYDITASAEGRSIMLNVVSRTADQVFIPLTVGGGLRTVEDMRLMLKAGADKVSINTAAVENPHLISDGAWAFGSQCVVLGLDAQRVPGSSPPAGGSASARDMTAATTRGWMPLSGQSAPPIWARAKLSSTAWTATVPGEATTWN